MLKATSSAVSSEPSWNFTPWRIFRSIVILSGPHAHDSTMCGWYLSWRSCCRNRSKTASYIDSRGLLGGTGWGSNEVSVSGKAMVTACFFWAKARRSHPTLVRPAAAPAPVVRRNVRRLIRMVLPSLVRVVMVSEPATPCGGEGTIGPDRPVHAFRRHRQLGHPPPDRRLFLPPAACSCAPSPP